MRLLPVLTALIFLALLIQTPLGCVYQSCSTAADCTAPIPSPPSCYQGGWSCDGVCCDTQYKGSGQPCLGSDTGDACAINGICYNFGGIVCTVNSTRNCADSNPCTVDSCVPGGCSHDGTTLEGSPCFVTPCVDGTCTYANGTCVSNGNGRPNCPSDPNPPCSIYDWTTATVVGNACVCSLFNNTAYCDDGFPCTINAECSGGACQKGTNNCTDHDECTLDFCTHTGCLFVPFCTDVRTWGNNTYGALGQSATTTVSLSPASVTSLFPDNITDISCNQYTSLAVSAGNAYGAGLNDQGQLLGISSPSWTFQQLTGFGVGCYVLSCSAGLNHTVCLAECSGTNVVYTFGSNSMSQLGVSGISYSSTPVLVNTGVFNSTILGVTAGATHTCAWTVTEFACWGDNTNFQSGWGNTPTSSPNPTILTFVNFENIDDTWAGASAGFHHTIAWTTQGLLHCWGKNNNGECGIASYSAVKTPFQVPFFQVKITIFPILASAGLHHSMAIALTNVYTQTNVYVTGYNAYGQLGTGLGNFTTVNLWTNIPFSSPATWLAAGATFSLVLTQGEVWYTGNFGNQPPVQSYHLAPYYPTVNTSVFIACAGYTHAVITSAYQP